MTTRQLLDKLDRRILFELDHNSRQSISDLARRIKTGRDRVEYRVDRLIDLNIIRRFVTSVNFFKLGFSRFKSYLRLESNRPRVAEFVAYLHRHPRVGWVALCDGSWDLIFSIYARTPSEFHAIHNQLLSEFNDVVLNFTAYTLVELKSFTRNYFVKAQKGHTITRSTGKTASIDKLDYDILRHLGDDSRTTAVKLAELLDTSPQVIKYRIQQMEQAQLITGYRLDLNLKALGMLSFKTQFFLRNYQLSLREQFIEYCDRNPFITYYIEQIGDCNIELELEVNSYQQYTEIIDEIRAQYSKLVRNFNTILLRDITRYNVPGDITEFSAAA